MTLGTSERIIVIVLAVALALFLTLAIVATVKLIQIFNHIKSITQKAEQIADKAEAVTAFFERTASPIALGKLISNMAETVMRKTKSKKNKE